MSRIASPALALVALIALAGCTTPPPQLDLSLKRPSVDGRYVVTLQPPVPSPPINQLHSWQVKLETPAGQPVAKANIAVDGGMPQHGHGLTTRPRVTREPADGAYRLEGMKFSMTGWWEIKLAIKSAEGEDTVTFNTMVPVSGAAR